MPLTVNEVATILDRSYDTVINYIKKGKLIGRKKDGNKKIKPHYQIDEYDILEYIFSLSHENWMICLERFVELKRKNQLKQLDEAGLDGKTLEEKRTTLGKIIVKELAHVSNSKKPLSKDELSNIFSEWINKPNKISDKILQQFIKDQKKIKPTTLRTIHHWVDMPLDVNWQNKKTLDKAIAELGELLDREKTSRDKSKITEKKIIKIIAHFFSELSTLRKELNESKQSILLLENKLKQLKEMQEHSNSADHSCGVDIEASTLRRHIILYLVDVYNKSINN